MILGSLLAAVGAAGPSIAAASASDDGAASAEAETEKGLKRLAGAWEFVSLTTDGRDAPKEFIDRGRWTIKGNELSIPEPGAATIAIKLDARRSPREIDMTGTDGPGKGITLKGIYKFEDGKLIVCLPGRKVRSNPDAPRPTEFKGGEGRSLLVLKRRDNE